ncbi:GroES-like protein [Hortaea werneckii]|nr:GroES-like protein [Hortaea werneckii]
MRAARYYGTEDIRIVEDLEPPVCGKGQVKIEPAFVGICGTDLHEFLGGPNFAPIDPHPVTKEKIPITIGHEFSGTIKEPGPDLESSNLKIGQKCAIQPNIYCSECAACKTGAENACLNGGFVGLSGGGGGMSEEVVVPAETCFPLPENVDLDVAALVEPLAVAWHAVDASPIASLPEPRCVVFGGGPIGLAVIEVLRARKAKTVICVEVAKRRQEFARDFGAHHVIDPTKHDVVSSAFELCGGEQPPDLAFDCAGVPATIETACKVIKSRGTVVNVAIWEKSVPFQPNWLVFREAHYQAVLGYQRKDFQGVIDALGDGRIQPRQMITSKIKMDRLVEDGYWVLIKEKDKHVKILVDVKEI